MSKVRPPRLARVEGGAARQAHVDLPAGSHEREFGSGGFFGPASHLLHAHPPTAWIDFEGPLRPRAFDLAALGAAADPFDAPKVLAASSVEVAFWRFEGRMRHLVRNADGDQLLFVHAGHGDLYCDFGHIAFRDGDYIVLPRGTQFRIEAGAPLACLTVEATGAALGLPDRGLLGQHALFDPALLRTPRLDEQFVAQRSDPGPFRVRIKRCGRDSNVTFPHNPLDTLAWQGELTPFCLNYRDIRPVVSDRYHLPPSAHTTFVSDRFVVCTFCPRPLESDPTALNVPFFHSNNDYDEVLFYHAGDFFSRDGIKPGMMTLHPAGFSHGPHPGARRAAERRRERTEEVAVMIDSLDPLEPGADVAKVEASDYVDSWREPQGGAP